MVLRRFPVPVAENRDGSATRWAAGERWELPEPRLASTVMLVRESDRGPEVFMLRRVSGMAFAPDVLVFPGGGVDERDADPNLPWFGPAPEVWAERLGVEVDDARKIIAAAVRELFEECGVFLASNQPGGPLVNGADPKWRNVRDALVGKELSLTAVLRQFGLWLRADKIAIKAHWVPPGYVKHRYSTWFFAALLPDNQEADGDTSESAHAEWVCPATLLDDLDELHTGLMPPTLHSLETLNHAGSAAAFVTNTDPVLHVNPYLVTNEDGSFEIEIPFPD